MDRGFLSHAELKTPNGRLYYYGAMVILLALSVLVLFPFVYAFTSGLKSSTEIFTSGLQLIPEDPQWSNYREAWESFEMIELFRSSRSNHLALSWG